MTYIQIRRTAIKQPSHHYFKYELVNTRLGVVVSTAYSDNPICAPEYMRKFQARRNTAVVLDEDRPTYNPRHLPVIRTEVGIEPRGCYVLTADYPPMWSIAWEFPVGYMGSEDYYRE